MRAESKLLTALILMNSVLSARAICCYIDDLIIHFNWLEKRTAAFYEVSFMSILASVHESRLSRYHPSLLYSSSSLKTSKRAPSFEG